VDLKAEPKFLSAEAEDYKIAQANAEIDPKTGTSYVNDSSREQGDFPVLDARELDYMDVAPNQIVGVSASLIPFLENDDANRALDGF
jgi:DNA-directed RNA polymerase subunit beta